MGKSFPSIGAQPQEPLKPFSSSFQRKSQRNLPNIMSTLSYAWNVHGTFNGDFMSASGTTASVDGIAEVHGTAGEGAPFNHSSWIWGGFGHYGLGFIKGGHKDNPCDKYPFHMTRHWRGEDGAHIWSSHHVTGAEGAWAGDVDVVAEYFQPEGPICKGLIRGQYPSHWVATKRSDKEVDVWGTVTLMVEGGGTYTAYVHEYMQFYEPCVTINRHYWKLEYLEAEYYPDHWYHKEAAVVDPNWTWGKIGEKTTFSLHIFTRFPKGVVNPFIYSLPEGFTVERKWWGQGGDHWATTHDVRYEGTHVNKRVQLVGKGFAPGSLMMWDGNKDKGAWIVKSWPQYALATPKGDKHIWYRGTFQFELNNGNFYSGYWEMDIHFRKPNPKMPDPYVVKFWPETWASKPHYWHFYEREEVEQSTYDKVAVKAPAAKPPVVEVAPAVVPEAVPEVVPEAAPEVAPEVVAEPEAAPPAETSPA